MKRIVTMLIAVLLALLVVEAAVAAGMPDCMDAGGTITASPVAHPCHQMPEPPPQSPKPCPMAAFCLAMAGCGLVALAPAAPHVAAFGTKADYAPGLTTDGFRFVDAPPLEPPRRAV